MRFAPFAVALFAFITGSCRKQVNGNVGAKLAGSLGTQSEPTAPQVAPGAVADTLREVAVHARASSHAPVVRVENHGGSVRRVSRLVRVEQFVRNEWTAVTGGLRLTLSAADGCPGTEASNECVSLAPGAAFTSAWDRVVGCAPCEECARGGTVSEGRFRFLVSDCDSAGTVGEVTAALGLSRSGLSGSQHAISNEIDLSQ